MFELLGTIIAAVVAVVAMLVTLFSYIRIYRKSNNQSPTTWRLKNSKDFKELKAKHFHNDELFRLK